MQKLNPTVSIIIPTYNRSHVVGQAIKSVLHQTCQDFEIIVVDDASTDNTEDVVNGHNDTRIHYLRHKQNYGAPRARNTGADVARGEYLAFLDSDDVWYPKLLERQLAVLVNLPQTVGMICCGMVRKQGNSYTTLRHGTRGLTFDENLMFGNGICTSSFVIRKAAFQAVEGFDVKFSSFQDFDFLLRMSVKYQTKAIDEVLMEYRLGNDSISLNMDSKAKGFERIINIYRSDILRLGLMPQYMFRLGQYHMLSGRLVAGWQYWAQALQYDLLNTKIWMHYLLTFGGGKFYKRVLLLHQRRVERQSIQES
jgi:glycosyltransferase involved in cell wall biosynthesis